MQNSRFDAVHVERQKTAIEHIVHDYAMLVSSGVQTKDTHVSPINHHIQHSFLLHCRKFHDFYMNQRGKGDFISDRFRPEFPTWDEWNEPMDRQLIHLSWGSGR